MSIQYERSKALSFLVTDKVYNYTIKSYNYSMERIDWDNFCKTTGLAKTDGFEELSYHLFCRQHNLSEGVRADYNQVGLETEPVLVDGVYYGFQSKYFEHDTDYSQIKGSIKKAVSKYKGRLNHILIYLNTNAKVSSEKAEEIKAIGSKEGVTIEWFTRSKFVAALSQPSNLDLAQLYFGLGDELGFIAKSSDNSKLTLLQSSQYLDLCFYETNGRKVRSLPNAILASTSKVSLVSGYPAAGKSVVMHKLFAVYSGLGRKSQKTMLNVLERNGAVPQIVNLKNCVNESLENILRGRQNDSNVRGKKLGFIYLFDGLDELSEKDAELVLSQLYELSNKQDTKKIVLSCRTGNLNRLKLFDFMKDTTEFKIGVLDKSDVARYFDSLGDAPRKKAYIELQKSNAELVNEIEDVFTLRLFWNAALELTSTSNIIDLYGIKIDKLLSDPQFYKDLYDLNLLNPKKLAILKLNEAISYEFQKRFQFQFLQPDLQELILGQYPRLDYQSVNSIINYLASLFFDKSDLGEDDEQSYIYQHRRYQEYFFINKLVEEYSKNPSVLREVGIISNYELFQKLFLRSLRTHYERQNNLIGCIEINLIDVYLGNHQGWGADDAYYTNSSDFIPALLNQEPRIFNELLEDENLQLKDKLLINTDHVADRFAKWKQDKMSWSETHYLKSTWESGLAWLMESTASFWAAGQQDMSNEFRNTIVKIQNLYRRNAFMKGISREERQHLQDPYWDKYEDFLYYQVVIKDLTPRSVFDEHIKPNYENMDETDTTLRHDERGKEKLVNSFLRVCVDNKPTELTELIDEFDEYLHVAFLDVLTDLDRLPVFIKTTEWHPKIRDFVLSRTVDITDKNYHIWFYKKYFDQDISDDAVTFINEKRRKILDTRSIDWNIYNYQKDFSFISYILGENDFTAQMERSETTRFHYYNERVLYAALFIEWISLLKGETTPEKTIRYYIRHISVYFQRDPYGKYLKFHISDILARIFAEGSSSNMRALKLRVLEEDEPLSPFAFYKQLHTHNKVLFREIVSESELEVFEKQLIDWDDDYQTMIDRCFELSTLFGFINPEKARYYFFKAMNDGALRHGWRKDPLVSYHLLDAYGILLEKNWLTDEQVEEYAELLYKLANKVRNITDGSGTSNGPYRLVEILSKHDLNLAQKYKEEFQDTNYMRTSQSLITYILLRKVEMGSPVEEIEKGMEEYYLTYDYENKPEAEYFEQKLEVYMAISESELYFDDERQAAFEKAYEQVSTMIEREVRYYLMDSEYEDLKHKYKALCKKYGKEVNIEGPAKKDAAFIERTRITEIKFAEEVKSAVSKQKVRGLYKKLKNYRNGIKLKNKSSWEVLVQRTLEINGDASMFINYLKDASFPHTNHYSSNSRNMHLGLAAALENPDSRQETLEYLYENTGHGGFVNMINTYAAMGNKDMAVRLFDKFFSMCKLLVY